MVMAGQQNFCIEKKKEEKFACARRVYRGSIKKAIEEIFFEKNKIRIGLSSFPNADVFT